jgi:hypothetical protein
MSFTQRLTASLFLIASCQLFAQQFSSEGGALIRVERAKPGEDVCVLLNDDGRIRVEKMFRARTDLSEGMLPTEELQQVKDWMNEEGLLHLTQDRISNPLTTQEYEAVRISIFRVRGWQNLYFADVNSRRPYTSIAPIVEWFNRVQKGAKTFGLKKVAGEPTNCTPQQGAGASLARNSALHTPPPKKDYLVRMVSSHAAERTVQDKCIIVFPDGSYRFEKSSQQVGAKKESQVFEGVMDSEKLHDLGQLLTTPELKSIRQTQSADPFPLRPLAKEFLFTTVVIPRDDGLQTLTLTTQFGASVPGRQPTGMTGLGYHIESEKAIRPLQEWLKKNIEGGKAREIPDALINHCAANP